MNDETRAAPRERRGRRMLGTLLLGVLMPLTLFAAMGWVVWRHDRFAWDTPMLRAIHAHASPVLDVLMIWVSRIGGVVGVLVLALLVVAALCARQRVRTAVFLGCSVAGAEVLNVVAKAAFHRARPHLWISPAPASGYGFPSDHAMGSMAVAVALTHLAWSTSYRWLTLTCSAVAVVLIGLSRLYLGVHTPSDVLAGWCAALAWVMTLSLLPPLCAAHVRRAQGDRHDGHDASG